MKNKILFPCLIFSISLASAAINNFQQNITAAQNKINSAKHTIAQITMLNTNRTMAVSGVAQRAKKQRIQKLTQILEKEINDGITEATKAQKLAKVPAQHNEVSMLYNELDSLKKQALGFNFY